MSTESPYASIPEPEVASGRLLAAVAYLPALCFVGLVTAPRNRFVAFHARQGLLFFLTEIVCWVALLIFDGTLGRIPILGFLVGAVVKFVVGLGFLAVTVYGAIKAANGEMIRLPFLGDAIERIPL
ncbi:MAG TPA: DUF4870 domain-containing protein [Candidatus Eisenbacteria bacterium]